MNVGFVLMVASSTIPAGFLECNGAAVSRTTYASLFSAIGTTWGSGDGSTTFNLPDLRGEFIRGWDHGRGRDLHAATRTGGDAVGSSQLDSIQNFTGTSGIGYMGHNLAGTQDNAFYAGPSGSRWQIGATATSGNSVAEFDSSLEVASSTETRPSNKYVQYCIKAIP
jgi:microcystin-dependent protein